MTLQNEIYMPVELECYGGNLETIQGWNDSGLPDNHVLIDRDWSPVGIERMRGTFNVHTASY